jgi:hypothetical protein
MPWIEIARIRHTATMMTYLAAATVPQNQIRVLSVVPTFFQGDVLIATCFPPHATTGHNSLVRYILVFFLPNVLWIIVPFVAVITLSTQLLRVLNAATAAPVHAGREVKVLANGKTA